jgi:hypothetical protein
LPFLYIYIFMYFSSFPPSFPFGVFLCIYYPRFGFLTPALVYMKTKSFTISQDFPRLGLPSWLAPFFLFFFSSIKWGHLWTLKEKTTGVYEVKVRVNWPMGSSWWIGARELPHVYDLSFRVHGWGLSMLEYPGKKE